MGPLTDNHAPRSGSLDARITQARAMLAGGDPKAVLRVCEDIVETYPESGEALSVMGDAYAMQDDWERAIDHYEQALDRSFDPAVMERLATARRNAIRLDQGDQSARPMVATLPSGPVTSRRAKASPYLVAAVVLGVLLIPLLGVVMLRSANGDGAEMSGDAPRSATLAEAAGPSLPGTYIDQPVRAAAQPASSSGRSATALGAASSPPRRAVSESHTNLQVPRYAPTPSRQHGGESAVASGRDKKIMRRLQLHRAGAGRSPIRATAMALDDYSGMGILTITTPPSLDLTRLESDVLLAAYQAAVGTVRTDKGIKALVIRCLSRMPNEQGQPEDLVLFRAAVAADTVRAWVKKNRTPTMQQISNEIFKDVWWDQAAIKRYATQTAARNNNAGQ